MSMKMREKILKDSREKLSLKGSARQSKAAQIIRICDRSHKTISITRSTDKKNIDVIRF